MTEKELIQKIDNLRGIKPDNDWKIRNREILYSQISNSAIQKSQSVFVAIREFFAKPSFAVVGFTAFLIVGSIFGMNAANNSRPGDSLYIAQIISEKAQLAITFDKKEKNNLEIKFANERAKQIAQVLSEAGVGTDKEVSSEKSEKLTADFKKEINVVREKISERKIADSGAVVLETEKTEEEEDMIVMGASLEKEDQGLQISENNTKPQIQETADTEQDVLNTKEQDTHQKLEEAEALFDSQDYEGAFNKLKELEALLSDEELSDEIKDLKEEYEAEILEAENIEDGKENDQAATSTEE